MRPRVLHVIPSLGQGGAERVLASLLRCQRSSVDHHILSLLSDAPFFNFDAQGIETLGLSRDSAPVRALGKVYHLRRHVNRIAPDIVHGWLYHGNAFSVGGALSGIPIVWSIHNTTLSASKSKRSTRLLDRFCAALSGRIPARIVYCSETARLVHEQSGYSPDRGLIIYNGVDLLAFQFDAQRRAELRRALGLPEDEFVVGSIGRYDAQKNHPLVVEAFAGLARVAKARLLLAGAGCSPENTELSAMLERGGVGHSSVLLGARHDIDALLSAIDVLVIGSSYGEALPMIAIEAAAARLPIIATDIGDVARFAEQADDVVPPDNAEAMTKALLRVHARRNRTARLAGMDGARAALLEPYSLERMSRAYFDLYRELIG
jgi:glycosyltransferase involved in cell wall biosynthesis